MPRIVKSQWDFGELFPPEATRTVLSVTELTASVKRLLEQEIGDVWVTGEVTNFRAQSSGHIYFALKDASAQLNCVLFRAERVEGRQLLADGQKVVLRGGLTVYEARGQYQLRVTAIQLQGIGALQARFEQLKQKLSAEGLFAPERKRPVPRFPRRIGLVTSPDGAALRDVLHVVKRRDPGLQIILAPCCVQGQTAAQEIARAIALLNRWSALDPANTGLDLILLTRGGGSLEDLWAFNEELVARAIAASGLPIISAIGHEIDFTISDFVADLRAATPSAAAELITEGIFSSCRFVAESAQRLRSGMARRLQQEKKSVSQWTQRLLRLHPRRRLDERAQRLDDARDRLWREARQAVRAGRQAWVAARDQFLKTRPGGWLLQRRERVRDSGRRTRDLARRRLERLSAQVLDARNRLRLLSPEQVLARGYSITTDAASGAVLREAKKTRKGQKVITRLASGSVRSVIEE